jgi:5-methylcytosine-specific restriction endonuclease McrA
MFCNEHEPIALLIELTPKLAKKRFRESIYEAWNHKCGYCGEDATSLDHIIPRFKSGSSNRQNLVPCCRRCNTNKGSQEMREWYQGQFFFSKENLDRIESWIHQETVFIFGEC